MNQKKKERKKERKQKAGISSIERDTATLVMSALYFCYGDD